MLPNWIKSRSTPPADTSPSLPYIGGGLLDEMLPVTHPPKFPCHPHLGQDKTRQIKEGKAACDTTVNGRCILTPSSWAQTAPFFLWPIQNTSNLNGDPALCFGFFVKHLQPYVAHYVSSRRSVPFLWQTGLERKEKGKNCGKEGLISFFRYLGVQAHRGGEGMICSRLAILIFHSSHSHWPQHLHIQELKRKELSVTVVGLSSPQKNTDKIEKKKKHPVILTHPKGTLKGC